MLTRELKFSWEMRPKTSAKITRPVKVPLHRELNALVHELLLEKLKKPSNDKRFSRLFFIKLKCCGIGNFTDWADSKWQEKNPQFTVPLSCCKKGGNTTTCNTLQGFEASKINQEVIP